MEKIISQLEAALGETLMLLDSFTEKELNTVPYEGSWTAGQVGRHLLRSEEGMDELLLAPAGPSGRQPDEKEPWLKEIFLDFSAKYQSPDFILPEDKHYTHSELIAPLAEVKDKMVEAIKASDLEHVAPLPDGHPLKGNTKMEMVYFVTYHTIRHNHQLQKIRAAV